MPPLLLFEWAAAKKGSWRRTTLVHFYFPLSPDAGQ